MNVLRSTRREFIATSLAIAAAPKFLFSSAKKAGRTLIDPCNGLPLAGVRIRLKNLATGKKIIQKTADDGTWNLDSFISDISEKAGHRVKASIAPLSIGDMPYAGLEHRFVAYPGGLLAKANRSVGHLSLIPLLHPGKEMGIDDDDFNSAWPALISDCLFSIERTPFDIPKDSARGALSGITQRKLRLFVGESLSTTEQEFVRDEILSAVEALGSGRLRITFSGTVPEDQEPFFADQVPAGSLMAFKRLDYPKSSTRIRFSAENPHEIIAALLYFDSFTLNSLFRDGAGGDEEISLARHIIQRAVAEILGCRPTMRLPNRTLMDANFTPQATIFRQGIRPEDLLLARIHYGSGWLGPGARLSLDGMTFISNDA